ncbi:Mth938-like domain-containing protein [Sphingomonas sp. RP10(2022)]|uniref:Mth938-like domain-containing protein n=1 Tax=Sphingomonas liriopis TaxID=2949094 RepID=A0A9X2KP73_9SPHN|nr:Mth938-like domain-containing protein [Sphingomonas liriopis]MCP3733647.1 Mth938-like domain-containing protein [Sphingomonas liriopis]
MEREGQAGGPIVRGFAGSGFRVDDFVYRALLLTPDSAAEWTPPPLAALGEDALATLTATAPEFVLIGTGAALVRPPLALVQALDARGIGVEAMDSRAAARAWGVLRSEGRVIAAALYPLDA